MSVLRWYLLAGLLVHKLVWEVLKSRGLAAPPEAKKSLAIRLVKAVKLAILAGIVVQVLLPTVLPIMDDPASLSFAGTLLFTAGLSLALAARFELGRNWSDIEAGIVQANHTVVETGVYRYIRHPIYVGDLALLVGLELALNSWLVIPAILLIPLILYKAIGEEAVVQKSLPGYEAYCQRTSRFLPLRFERKLVARSSVRSER